MSMKLRSDVVRALVPIVLVLVTGCQSGGGAMTAAQVNQAMRAKKYLDQMKVQEKDQDWAARFATARRLVEATPDGDMYGDARAFAIGAMEDYVDQVGASEELDAEAQRYYDDAMRVASELQRAQLDHLMALYYSSSGRNGLSLPFMMREMDYWQKADDAVQIMLVYDGIAAAYNDRGETALRDIYRDKALAVAREWFVIGERPPPGQAWVVYSDILNAKMSDIAAPGRADDILALWAEEEPIYEEYLEYDFKGPLNIAELLAISHDFERAQQFFDRAAELAETAWAEHPKLADRIRNEVVCIDGSIKARSERWREALTSLGECFEQRENRAFQLGIPEYRLAGLVHEKLGELDEAIAMYRAAIAQAETTRASFDVAQRTAFFRSIARDVYWGLIRCLTRKALEGGEERYFLQALQAAEQVRGRQLGELLDPQAESALSLSALSDLRRRLPADTAVLGYVLSDQEIVVLGFSRGDWVAALVPYEAAAFRERARRLAQKLADPGSSVQAIDDELAALGQLLLDPVARLLRDARVVVALPDGAVNLIPFDLLATPAPGAGPLISQRVVRLLPTLRLLEPAGDVAAHTAEAGLYAVADPLYDEAPAVAGLEPGELRSIAADSDYLGYFTPLPETLSEVKAIARLFAAGRVQIVSGRAATESAIKGADLTPYRYVHLATHGILGGEVPGVAEPALVLAREPGEDGFLTASEVEALRLDADLAVLSACKTGSGQYVTGEGVMGMSRAFLVAGSRSVLVSLWSVDSRATEELMVAFYRQLEGGLAAPEALRQAKLELRRSWLSGSAGARGLRVKRAGGDSVRVKDAAHPFYWSAFVLVGR